MIGGYLVRGLALVNQMGNQFIFFCGLGFGHVNPSPGTFKEFQVLAVSKMRIIEVLVKQWYICEPPCRTCYRHRELCPGGCSVP